MKRYPLGLLLCVMPLALFKASSGQAPGDTLRGRIIVEISEMAEPAVRQAAVDQLDSPQGLAIARSFTSGLAGGTLSPALTRNISKHPRARRIYYLSFHDTVDIEAQLDRVRAMSAVTRAWPDIFAPVFLAGPNDPRYVNQWNLSRMAIEGAWRRNTGSQTIPVAVIDTGVEWQHDDLSANLWINPAEVSVQSAGVSVQVLGKLV